MTSPLTLEIVSHAWNYYRLLTYQLSSLVLHPPKSQVTMTVFYSPTDTRTAAVLRWFANQPTPPNVIWHWWPLEVRHLMRRAIGRNKAAKTTTADIIWFTDCDYVFGKDCLDFTVRRVRREMKARPECSLFFPRCSVENISHELGAAAIHRVTAPGIYEIDTADFEVKMNRIAIGGLQIVRGSTARSIGYLDGNERLQKPCDVWQKAIGDVHARRAFGPSQFVKIPNLYRIRHGLSGTTEVGLRL